MTWFKVDDGFWSHPKTAMLSDAAVAMWVRAGSYSCQHLTDGFISPPMLRMLGPREAVDELVEAGLWNTAPGGWQFHDWDEYQETSETVKRRREQARDRQRRARAAREKKRATPRDDSSSVTGDVTRDNTREFSTPDPTRPDLVGTDVPTNPPTPQQDSDGGGTLVPLRRPKGGREVAERLNATAHSAEAHMIARQYVEHAGSAVPGKVLGDIARSVDECLASGVGPEQIARGLVAWHESPITATSQIPSFVHKAAAKQAQRGRSKPTDRALSAMEMAETLIAQGVTRE
ncbi:hypothetical protein C5E45_32850 [Nocardia nova]|uniref:Uncharacterized protein n=1 Tax=Nocardia nova TaxID=37330 RepID=A0A2S6ACT6_9NOCA|nr:hypothetical protein [Nocardia nova]PPJ31881.1 hypothetical protein C5E45_32850 [Nocardia nova]